MYVESPSPTMVQATSVIPPSGRNQDQYRLVDPASVNSAIVQVNKLKYDIYLNKLEFFLKIVKNK